MKARILTTIAMAAALALTLTPASRVRGADPLPNIWIDLVSLHSTYLGQSVPVGAQIVAFDTQTGVQCGQFTVTTAGYYGTMPCYGDDGVYPGATPGHLLGFRINGAAAETEAVSLNGASIPTTTPVYWDQNLSLWEVNLHARLGVSAHLLVSSLNPSYLGQTVTFATAVVGNGPNGEKPMGSVQFAADGVPLGTADLVNGQAALSTADLTSGNHTITAMYEGDAAFYPSTASLSQMVQYTHLSLTKVAIETSFNAAGATLHYTLVATNDGNVMLTGASISDVKLGALTCSPAQPATLAPGTTLTCSGTYLTTQADVDAGQMANTANATGMFGTAPVAATPASVTVPASQNPLLALTKSAAPTNYTTVGQVINYTLVATNTGNLTLTGVSITDAQLGALACPQPVTLVPGASLTCTGSHTITWLDLLVGRFNNTANASAHNPQGNPVSATASVTVQAITNPHIILTKNAVPTGYDATGQVISYTLLTTNDGGLPLYSVTISDPKLGTLSCMPAQPATLAPAASLTCTGSHTITQADLDTGQYANMANVSARDFFWRWISATASRIVTLQPAPPAVSDLQADKSGANVVLTWTDVGGSALHYEVWRASTPYFAPGTAEGERIAANVSRPANAGDPVSFTDEYSHLGNPNINDYYVVLTVSASGQKSAASNRTGEFDFWLLLGD